MAHIHPVPPKIRRAPDRPGADDIEEQLDEALEESFPASDPPAIIQPDDGHEEAQEKDSGPNRPRHRGDRP